MSIPCKTGAYGVECSGCMSCVPDEVPVCPICHEETDRFKKNKTTGDIVGCTECVDDEDAWEIKEAWKYAYI